MANELPYFRFTVQAWQNGKIDLESYDVKGLFISVCGYYWIQDCSITLAMLKRKFSNAIPLLEQLILSDIIKHDKSTDKVDIFWLNEQFDTLSNKRKLRQVAGSKGGKQKRSNAKAMLKQNGSYKDKDKDKNLTHDFEIFWELYDKKVGDKNKIFKKWGNLSATNKSLILEHLPKYKLASPDKKFRKDPSTYLNNNSWLDEIIGGGRSESDVRMYPNSRPNTSDL